MYIEKLRKSLSTVRDGDEYEDDYGFLEFELFSGDNLDRFLKLCIDNCWTIKGAVESTLSRSQWRSVYWRFGVDLDKHYPDRSSCSFWKNLPTSILFKQQKFTLKSAIFSEIFGDFVFEHYQFGILQTEEEDEEEQFLVLEKIFNDAGKNRIVPWSQRVVEDDFYAAISQLLKACRDLLTELCTPFSLTTLTAVAINDAMKGKPLECLQGTLPTSQVEFLHFFQNN